MQGQGVDYMMADITVPRDIPLVRLVDPDMSNALSHWAILPHWIFGAMRRITEPVRLLRIGTLLCNVEQGEQRLALWVLERLAELWRNGLPALIRCSGLARSPRQIANVMVFAGDSELAPFLDGLNILVSVLPLTPATRGIMNSDMFNQLAKGAFIINGGRGPQLVEDLLDAIGRGQIAGLPLMYLQRSHCRQIIHSGQSSHYGLASCCSANQPEYCRPASCCCDHRYYGRA